MSQINIVHNMLILFGKWFINKSKSNDKPLIFKNFVKFVCEKLELYAHLSVYSWEIKQLFKKVK